MKKKIGEQTHTENIYVDVCDECEIELTDFNWIKWDGEWSDAWDVYYSEKHEVCSFECLSKQLEKDIQNGFESLLHGPSDEMIHITISSSHFQNFLQLLRSDNAG